MPYSSASRDNVSWLHMRLHEQLMSDSFWEQRPEQPWYANIDDFMARILGIYVAPEVLCRIDHAYKTIRRVGAKVLELPAGDPLTHPCEADCLLKVVEDRRVQVPAGRAHAPTRSAADAPDEFDRVAQQMADDPLYSGKTTARLNLYRQGARIELSRRVLYLQPANNSGLFAGKGSDSIASGRHASLFTTTFMEPATVGSVYREAAEDGTLAERLTTQAQLIMPTNQRAATRIVDMNPVLGQMP